MAKARASPGYGIHEACAAYPPPAQERLDELRASMKEHGFRKTDPILVWLEKGLILDGRSRLAVSKELGIKPVFQLVEFADERAALEAVRDRNNRRDLDNTDRVLVGVKLVPMYEAAALERKQATQAKPGKKIGKVKEIFPGPCKGQARDLAGAAVGVSGKLIDAGKLVLNEGTPELVEAMKNKEISVSAAAEQVRAAKGFAGKSSGKGTAGKKTAGKKPEIGPLRMGIGYAESAIIALEQIKLDDLERKEAFALVRRWLDEHA